MGVFRTSLGRIVPHCHLGETPDCKKVDHDQVKIALIRAEIKRLHPDAVEFAPPTLSYNCIGAALAKRHGWFNCRERLLRDDCTPVSLSDPRTGDVLIYELENYFAHVGIVTSVEDGQIERVRSKWGDWSELCHALKDVDESYGVPAKLFRPHAGRSLLALLLKEEEDLKREEVIVTVAVEEMVEGFVLFAGLGNQEMSELRSPEEKIQRSIELLSRPEVYIRVGLASTPEVARSIIGKLPGVKELIEIGPTATETVLHLLETARDQNIDELSGIALYLLQRIPTAKATKPIANAISNREFTGLNLNLAADALLISADIESVNEDPVKVALREAERLK